MDRDLAAGEVHVVLRLVNELRNLVEAKLLGLLAEHEEHGINHVGLAAPIGADNRREALQQRENGEEDRRDTLHQTLHSELDNSGVMQLCPVRSTSPPPPPLNLEHPNSSWLHLSSRCKWQHCPMIRG